MKQSLKFISLIFLGTLLLVVLGGEGLAASNPAAKYCKLLNEEFGDYSYEIRTDNNGNEFGVCVLPDGKEYDGWKFYLGEVARKYSYCIRKGLDLKVKGEEVICSGSSLQKSMLSDFQEKFSVSKLLSNSEDKKSRFESKSISEKPDSFELGSEYNASSYPYWDWRDPPTNTIYSSDNFTFFDTSNGWVTPVKDQESCGSCWAFSTTAAVESKYEIEQNESRLNLDLSEQKLLSCDTSCYPGGACQNGCSGGMPDLAMRYIMLNGTVDELCFPYSATEESCSNCCNFSDRKWNISSYTSTWSYNFSSSEWYHYSLMNNETMQWLINNGPMSAAVKVGDGSGFYNDGGIYRCTNDAIADHAVLLVGYNYTGEINSSYWILKNSWGSSWGDNGYFKLGFDECNFTSQFDFSEGVNSPDFKPSIDLIYPSSGYRTGSSSNSLNFTVINRNATSSTCDLIINEVIVNTTSATNNISDSFMYNLSEGEHNWSVNCWESGFGIANSSEIREIVVDLSGPQVNFTNETEESVTLYRNWTYIEVNASDSFSNISSCVLYWNSSLDDTLTNNGSGSSIYAYINKSDISNGNYTFNVLCNDSLGNSLTSSSSWVYIDVSDSPQILSVNTPASGATNQNLNVTLNITITDSNEDLMNVTFYNNVTDLEICNQTNVSSEESAVCSWINLNESTTYYWYTNVTDGNFTTKSSIYNFTTDYRPNVISNSTSPTTIYANTNINVNITCTDSDNTNLTAYIKPYLNGSNQSIYTTLITNNTNTLIYTYESGNFSKGNNITFEIWCSDNILNSTKINTSLITVNNSLPTVPNLLNPSNGSSNTDNSVNFNWSSTDVDGDNITYYLAINSSSNSNLTIMYNGTDSNYSYSTTEGITYYWRVKSSDNISNSPYSSPYYFTESAPQQEEENTPSGGGGSVSLTDSNVLDSKTQVFSKILPGENVDIDLGDDSSTVSRVRISSDEEVNNEEVKVSHLEDKPSSAPSVDSPVYSYLEITSSSGKVKGEIKFKVNKSWIEEKGLDENKIFLLRNVDNSWERLDTRRAGETTDYCYYFSDTEGFSYFAVSGDEKVLEEVNGTNDTINEVEDTFENETAGNSSIYSKPNKVRQVVNILFLLILIPIIAIFSVILFYIRYRK